MEKTYFKRIDTIALVIGVFSLIAFPLTYLNNNDNPWEFFHYSWVLLANTVLFVVLSFVNNNVTTRSFLPFFSKKSNIAVGLVYILGLCGFVIVAIMSDYRDNTFLFFSILVSLFCAVVATIYGGNISSWIVKVGMLVFAFLFAILVWLAESFSSYYDGVEIGALQASALYQNTVKQIILENQDEKVQKEKILDFSKNVSKYAKIDSKITKNNETFLVPILQDRGGYVLSKENSEKFKDGLGNEFVVSYRFYNRPELITGPRSKYWGGLTKAIIFSTNEANEEYIDKGETKKRNNSYYFKKENYLRSLNLWWVFWLIYALFLYGYCHYQEKGKALLEREEAFAELEDYKIFFDDIRKQIDDKISDSRNTLQMIDSSWSKIAQEANQSVLDGYKIKRHDTFNYLIGKLKTWGKEDYLRAINTPEYKQKLENYMEDVQTIDQSYYKDKGDGHSFLNETYGVILNPWLLRIRQDLKNLDDIFDLTPTNTKVDRIIQEIISEKTLKKVKCKVNVENNINRERECYIILDKLQSMVYNLLENSSQAGARYKDKLRKQDRKLARSFISEINMDIREVDVDSKKYLSVEVQDNCGGFPPELEDKIYVEKVKSSKATNIDHGNGTYLIGRFAKRMGIIVKHKTIMLEGNQKGAQTTLLIPYV